MAGATTRRGFLASAAATAAAGPALAGEPVQVGDPPPGKAFIVFYRKWEYFGAAISYIVREGNTQIGRLGAGSYFIATVEPGLHTYTVHAERHNDMQITVEAGEIYYVRYEMDIGVILYQPTLEPSEQRLFDAMSSKLKLSASVNPNGDLPPPPSS